MNNGTASKIRVLLADDHAMVREGIRALLAIHDDMEVVGEAADGQEAMDKARTLAPDVVVMDISMPVVDGMEATRRISKDNSSISIVALSRHDNLAYVRTVLAAGAVGYVLKRAVSAALASAIRAAHRGEVFIDPSVARSLLGDYVQLLADRNKASVDPFDLLTAQEKQVFRLMIRGLPSRAIARSISLSPKTVANYKTKIMQKLGVTSNTELLKYAIRRGLTNDDI